MFKIIILIKHVLYIINAIYENNLKINAIHYDVD